MILLVYISKMKVPATEIGALAMGAKSLCSINQNELKSIQNVSIQNAHLNLKRTLCLAEATEQIHFQFHFINLHFKCFFKKKNKHIQS